MIRHSSDIDCALVTFFLNSFPTVPIDLLTTFHTYHHHHHHLRSSFLSSFNNGKIDSLQSKTRLSCQETHRWRFRSRRSGATTTAQRKAARPHHRYQRHRGGGRRQPGEGEGWTAPGGRGATRFGYARFVLVRRFRALGPPRN